MLLKEDVPSTGGGGAAGVSGVTCGFSFSTFAPRRRNPLPDLAAFFSFSTLGRFRTPLSFFILRRRPLPLGLADERLSAELSALTSRFRGAARFLAAGRRLPSAPKGRLCCREVRSLTLFMRLQLSAKRNTYNIKARI